MGIWRIPVDEIDRPGSFASHMNRSIVLLLEVLSQLKDHDTLLKVSFMLQRNPDQGKKYLRDVDRQVLAKRAFFLTVKVLEDNLNSLTGEPAPPAKEPAPPMGEMTTTDPSSRPSAEDSTRHALPKKTVLSEGISTTGGSEQGPREASQQAMPPSVPLGTDNGEKPPELSAGKVEGTRTQGSVRARAGSEEPMDLDGAGLWRRPSTSEPNQAHPQAPRTVMEPVEKMIEGSRAPELSLEELSISSRQQQLQGLQASLSKGPMMVTPSGAEQGQTQGPLRRPNRKRKMLEDVESGKTLLLDAYRVWQQGQKVMTYDLGRVEKIMSETYMLIKQVDEDVALDQAVKFCQIQLAPSAQRQSSVDAPTTPKYAKEHRDIFFPASLPTSVLLSHAACHSLSNVQPQQQDHGQAKAATAAAYELPGPRAPRHPAPGPQDQLLHRRLAGNPGAASSAMAFLPHSEVAEEPPEGLSYRQQETHLCQQMKLATVSPGQDAQGWKPMEPTATCSGAQTSAEQLQYSSSDLSKFSDPSRVRSRIPPNMPKLFIPSTATKFPPEITVTPPTPTLLSPKGSISEETKQRLKNVILSSQSAATVKKDSLAQPALEVQETSSQESSLESESDEEEEEEEDYMDV